MSEWNYNRIGENGRLYSYYGKGQEWMFTERGRQHVIKVIEACTQSNGVQYYLISKDGNLEHKLISAARLHYILNQKQAEEVKPGMLIPFPLLVEEVNIYFEHNEWTDCPNCGGNGIERGKICFCAERLSYEIKSFNAKKRLADLMSV